ncbi:MFS transporter [Marinilactibacillus sp. Marseille-P9653]|uniref:MFS transporter n=1 Tax=Marinilactibacillus sp. Marseille-P9653 TaxID=2866583 RepID=UPI001CE3CB1F|nr:MFS transporter [Marinilactibacillus sp. Marseille-P9653]
MKLTKHWKVLACVSGLAASSIGINLNTIGVFYTPVSESLGFFRGSFALHTTIMSLVMSFMALTIPRLLTRFDIKKGIQIGVGLSVVTTLLMAMTESLWLFYLLAAIRGIGASFYSPVPLTILVNNWFEKKNGLAMSLGFGSSGVAGALLSPIFSLIIHTYSWQLGFVVMGLFSLMLCLPALLYKFSLHPNDEGLQAYGKDQESESKSVKINSITENIKVNDVRFIVLASIGLLLSLITGLPHHLPGYAETIGFSATIGAWMLSASMFGNIAFKLLGGTLGDRVGSIKTAFMVIGLNFIALVIMLMVQVPSVMILSSFFFGAIMCFPIVVLPMLTIHFYGRERYMKVYPFFSLMTGIGGASGVTLVGYAYDFTKSYTLVFIIALSVIIISLSMILLLLSRRKTKYSLQSK